ncbi:MAG: hypothetical protein ABIR96_10560 [Bdellovibrionota bacterium]
MKRISFFAAACIALSASQSRAQNLSVDVHGALALINYSKLNVEGGTGSTFGTHPAYFFHRSVGVFTGLDYISRPMDLNSSETTKWLEVPFGLMFRGGEGASQMVGLGLSFSKPLNDFEDSGGTHATQGGLSLVFLANRYYELNSAFSLGIYSDIRYSLHSPFAEAALSEGRILSFDIGLGARVNL